MADTDPPTTRLPIPGRVLLRASRPLPPSTALVYAITLSGPDAVVVQLAAD